MLANGYIEALSPELILTVAATVALLLGVFGRGKASGLIFVVSIVGIAASTYATWTAGGTFDGAELTGIKVGSMATYTRLITLAIGALLVLISWHLPGAADRGEFFGMVLFSMTGAMLAGLADDLVVLLIALELVGMPTYILVATGRPDLRAQEAGVKYFFLGAMASAIAAYGFSFLYGLSGTTAISTPHAGQTASIARAIAAADGGGFVVVIGLTLAVFGLAFKVAAVPLHFYAADVYEGAAAPVTGMLGFMPKLAGFVALAKILSTTGGDMPEVVFYLIWALAAATMIVGNVLALLQSNVKRILAYSSIAHSGYMLVAVLVGPAVMAGSPISDGVGAMMFYIFIYGATNLGAFAVVGLLRANGGEGERLDDLAGLSRSHPATALALSICAFSLMGMPPAAGFIGKVYIFGSALSLESLDPHKYAMIVLAVVGLLTSAIGAVYYLRIIASCYLREPTVEVTAVRCGLLKLGVGLAALIVLAAGIAPARLISSARQAAGDVLQVEMRSAQPMPDAAANSLPRLAEADDQ